MGSYFAYYLTGFIMIPVFIFATICQLKVKNSFKTYSRFNNRRGLTGAQAAYQLLQLNGITDVNGEYQPNSFKAAVARTVVAALKQLITLTREQDHGSTQTYDPERLQERINAISRSLPEEEKEEDLQPKNEDISYLW